MYIGSGLNTVSSLYGQQKGKPNDNNAIQIKRSIDICRLVPTIL